MTTSRAGLTAVPPAPTRDTHPCPGCDGAGQVRLAVITALHDCSHCSGSGVDSTAALEWVGLLETSATIIGSDTQTAQPVIVHLPSEHGGLQVLVQHHTWGVEVGVRADSGAAWTPATLAGVEVEVRSA